MDESSAYSNDDRTRVLWYVMRAYKCEKKAEQKLCAAGLEFFIPKRYAMRQYHGVKSRRLVPVIPSLVFVHASRLQINEFKKGNNFLQFTMWEKSTGSEFLTVPSAQMDNFIRVASRYDEDLVYCRPEEISLESGTRVRIHGGGLDGVEGFFMRVQGKHDRRVVVMLDGVMAVAAQVHPDLVEVLSPDAELK